MCVPSWAMTGGWNIHFILIIPQITPSNLKASPSKISTWKKTLLTKTVPDDSFKLARIHASHMISGILRYDTPKAAFWIC